jgi:hypothetical protein
MNKGQSKTEKPKVTVVKEVTYAIPVGRDQYVVKNTADGRGVNVQNKQGNIFIPFGDEGKAILESLNELVDAGSGRNRRRTAAEIKAQQA